MPPPQHPTNQLIASILPLIEGSDYTIAILRAIGDSQQLDEDSKLRILESILQGASMLSKYAATSNESSRNFGYLLLHKAIYESVPETVRHILSEPITASLRISWNAAQSESQDFVKTAERIISHAEIFHQYYYIAEVWLDVARNHWKVFYSQEDALYYIQKSLDNLTLSRGADDSAASIDKMLIEAHAQRLKGEILRHSGQYPDALIAFDLAAQAYSRMNTIQGLIDCQCLTASVYFMKNNLGNAKEILNIALAHPHISDYQHGYAAALNLLGNVLSTEGDNQQARFYHEQSLEQYRISNDTAGQASVLLNLGTICEAMADIENARRFYQESLLIGEESGNKTEQSLVLNNLGKIYLDTHNYTEALACFERSYQISKAIGNVHNQELSLLNVSELYSIIGDYDRALQSLETLRKIIGETGHRLLEAAALINVGEIYFQTKNYRASEASFKNSLAILDDIGEHPDWESEAINGLNKLQSYLFPN